MNIRHFSEKVWCAINDNENITLSELSTRLEISIEIVALSVGWLAAEDRVYISGSEDSIRVSPKNNYPFYFG